MSTRQTEMLDTLRDELERYPVAFRFKPGGKHLRLTVTTDDGRDRMMVFSKTPSDRRAGRNALGVLRRLMAELKVEPRGTDG